MIEHTGYYKCTSCCPMECHLLVETISFGKPPWLNPEQPRLCPWGSYVNWERVPIDPDSLEKTAMAIVHHVGEVMGVDVDTRQSKNDECIDFATHKIRAIE